ncbi:MAG: DUF2818 family protein [Burkholderiaceae bacterium]|jgi:hypothetical protein|nr:DUF2818 family protein [Burkholderiaceae bacterium]
MNDRGALWFLIGLALIGANLPFFNRWLFAVVPLRWAHKPLAVRLAELLALYFGVGGIGLWLENDAGQIAPQGWQFYAVTLALFLTFAFPGFVWRYLYRRKG